MFCIKCGKEIDDKSKFCPFCGEKVDNNLNKRPVEEKTAPDAETVSKATEVVSKQESIIAQKKVESPKESTKKKTWFRTIISPKVYYPSMVVLVGLAVFLSILQSKENEKDKVQYASTEAVSQETQKEVKEDSELTNSSTETYDDITSTVEGLASADEKVGETEDSIITEYSQSEESQNEGDMIIYGDYLMDLGSEEMVEAYLTFDTFNSYITMIYYGLSGKEELYFYGIIRNKGDGVYSAFCHDEERGYSAEIEMSFYETSEGYEMKITVTDANTYESEIVEGWYECTYYIDVNEVG